MPPRSTQAKKRQLAQALLEPPEPFVEPGADDPEAMVLELKLPHDDDPPRPLAGFVFFWLRYVRGFRPQYHCANCLVGPYHPRVSATLTVPSRILLDQRQPVAYLCGVSDTYAWASNVHLPLIFAPGERVKAETFNGVRVVAHNARELPIPWVEDGWNDFPLSYTTCRNWQFGIARFGYNGARPVEDELRTSEHRSQQVAELAWLRQRGKLSFDELRARLRAEDIAAYARQITLPGPPTAKNRRLRETLQRLPHTPLALIKLPTLLDLDTSLPQRGMLFRMAWQLWPDPPAHIRLFVLACRWHERPASAWLAQVRAQLKAR